MVGFPLGLQRACSVPAACTACFKFIIGYNSPIVKKKNGKNGKQINFKNPEIGPRGVVCESDRSVKVTNIQKVKENFSS